MMSAADLAARAAEHKAHNLKVEQTKGSGYHDLDTDPVDRSRQVAPQHNGLPRLSEHVIAYFGETDVTFVNEDAGYVLAALHDWCEANAPKDVHDPLPGTFRKLLKFVPKLAVVDDVLTLRLSEWNEYLYALYDQGIGVTGAPLESDGTTP